MTLLLNLALASGWELHAHGALGTQDPQLAVLGLGTTAWWSPVPRLRVEALAQAGLSASALPRFDLRPELRLYPTAPGLALGDLSLLVGYGVAFDPAPGPLGSIGLGLDLPSGLRLQLRYLGMGPAPAAAQLSVGWVAPWSPEEPVVVVEPEPEPEPEPVEEPTPGEVLRVTPDGALVWVPHPWCTWMPVEEAQALLAELDPELLVRVIAEGHLPAQAAVGSGSLALQPAPAQGALLVVAWQQDEVRVDGIPLAVGGNGVAVATTPEGLLRVEVVGGGRRMDVEVAPVDGHALWLRSPTPSPLLLHYAVNSSEVTAADRQALQALVADAGGWSFQVQGSFSPEGELERNRTLASARAESAAAALVAAGLPAERIQVMPPPELAPQGEDVEALRTTRVIPIPGATP